MNPIAEDALLHYGMPRRSGRYPWGSGDNPYQHSRDLLARYEELKKQGKSESEIAAELGYFNDKGEPSSGKLRAARANAKNERDLYRIETAKSLREDGLGPTEIGRKMGVSESTVRGWLKEDFEVRARQAQNTAFFIEDQILSKGMIDIGTGVEKELGISKEMLNQALLMLEEEGYPIYKGGIPQVTNAGQQTNQRVICPKGTPHKDIYNYDQIHPLNEDNYTSRDGGETFSKFVYPKSMDSKRMMVRYAEDGGIDKDGIVELRRGVADLSLGNDHYSQIRILVDNDRYIKGMAIYGDDKDFPPGVDVIFNTNKGKDVPMRDVLKKIKDDPDNPFGSLIKAGGQSTYFDKDGNEQLSLINKRAGEGDWDEWKDALPSQFLGKQTLYMAKKQLNLAKADKRAEYDDICSLTNPTIKKHLLEDFANNCDAASVHLKAAALPGQKYHVIIPVNTLKDNEIYAPGYEPGTKVALVRYPHGGTFEIPILTVNNKHEPAKKIIGNTSIDAVGINKKIADRLSGADFDGDTVMVIPTHDKAGKVKVTSTPPLKGLEGFDPKMTYGYDKKTVDSDGKEHYYRNGREYPLMSKKGTQTQMGIISNLITDMTLAKAPDDEMAAAVRHSMVVIDAEKHHLDYKTSEVQNNIATLKKRYQRSIDIDGNEHVGGASTILSRAKGQYSVDKRQGSPYINSKDNDSDRHPYDPSRPEGALIFKTADDLYRPKKTVNKKTGIVTLTTTDGKKIKYDPSDKESRDKYQPIKTKDEKTGETIYKSKDGYLTYKLEKRMQESTRMAETDDAYTLISDLKHPMEIVYADYANSMKLLANNARKEMIRTGKVEYKPSAKAAYQAEVSSLMRKLNDAELNTPRERAAQRLANAEVAAKKQAYLEKTGTKMEAGDVKKANQQAITKARNEVGSISRRDRNIEITDREWEAIQAGAISENKLKRILNNTDVDKLKERAMPRAANTLSQAQVDRIKALADSNYTLEQIAKKVGKSTTTVSKYLKGVN